MRIVKEAGGWESLIGRYFGQSVPAEQLEFGDVVLGHPQPPFERTTLLGICDEELFMAPDSEGLAWLPMANALRGWKIADIAKRQRELLNV